MFGGIGCGVYCMLFHVLIAVFIAGLMIGRTPEYLGKKLGAWEATWAVIGVTAAQCRRADPDRDLRVPASGIASMANAGPHGLSEVLYAFGEAANNNGSAFAGLNANVPIYNVLLASASSSAGSHRLRPRSRLSAGSRPRKPSSPPPARSPCTAGRFGSRLTGVIVVVAALTSSRHFVLGRSSSTGSWRPAACSDNQPNF